MDKEKVIELLNKDLQDEHGAIIQYLSHAYGMGEGEMACEIEAISLKYCMPGPGNWSAAVSPWSYSRRKPVT